MGTILDSARPVDAEHIDPANYRIRALLAGETGSGKSTGALTLPGRKLIIEYDNRLASIMGSSLLTENDKVIQILERTPKTPKAWIRAEALREEIVSSIRDKTFLYDAIIEDGLTSLNRICMYWALILDGTYGLGGSPAEHHYGPQIKNLGDHLVAMSGLPVHYILTCHFDTREDRRGNFIGVFPKVYGKQQRSEVCTWFNEVYYCLSSPDPKTGRATYKWWSTHYGEYELQKSALNREGNYWESPVQVNLNEPFPGFKKLMIYRFGEEVMKKVWQERENHWNRSKIEQNEDDQKKET